jgi:hypothetical protein
MNISCDEAMIGTEDRMSNSRTTANFLESPQQLTFSLLQMVFIFLFAFLLVHIPPPGWAVGLTGLVAAAMSVHPGMKNWQKGIWIAIIGALLLVEFRAITIDRRNSDIAAKQDRAAQDEAFHRVLQTQNDEFRQTTSILAQQIAESQREYQATITGFTRSMNAVSGGSSYCFLTDIGLNLSKIEGIGSGMATMSKVGEDPLTGVRAVFTNYPSSDVPGQHVGDPVGEKVVVPVDEEVVDTFLPDMPHGKIGVPQKFSGKPMLDDHQILFHIPAGLTFTRDRVDLAIDYEGKSMPWRQVLHGVIVHTESRYRVYWDNTVLRNGKSVYHHVDQAFPVDGYRWHAR